MEDYFHLDSLFVSGLNKEIKVSSIIITDPQQLPIDNAVPFQKSVDNMVMGEESEDL